jgi:alanine dehydrogenase
MPQNGFTLYSNPVNLRRMLREADLLIGAVLIRGDRAPTLVTREMLGLMKPGAVIVDVAVDQGGCVETIHPTTHAKPTYIVNGIVHYGVANMPGAVAGTSTYALTNVTLPYLRQLADKGWQHALRDNPALRNGLNLTAGEITFEPVAELFGLPYREPLALLQDTTVAT